MRSASGSRRSPRFWKGPSRLTEIGFGPPPGGHRRQRRLRRRSLRSGPGAARRPSAGADSGREPRSSDGQPSCSTRSRLSRQWRPGQLPPATPPHETLQPHKCFENSIGLGGEDTAWTRSRCARCSSSWALRERHRRPRWRCSGPAGVHIVNNRFLAGSEAGPAALSAAVPRRTPGPARSAANTSLPWATPMAVSLLSATTGTDPFARIAAAANRPNRRPRATPRRRR